MNLQIIARLLCTTSDSLQRVAKRSAALVVALALFAPFANAHIDLQRAGTHVAKYEQGALGADTKKGSCGNPDGVATGAVFTYKPGETISVSLAEYIRHPGYFRIAFDVDGDDDFVDPRWIVALDPDGRPGGCPIVECDNCTLQIIQVMEDPAGRAHGVYNTTTQNDQNDVYHQCIDIVLSKDAVEGQAANAAALALMPNAEQ